jgi:hypothetical protein
MHSREKHREPVLVEGFRVGIDAGEVMRVLGGGKGVEQTRERFERAVTRAIATAEGLIAPKGIYTVVAGKDLPGSDVFADLEKVAFCICTIGPDLEREVSELSKREEILRAVVLDSAGSVAAEAVADYMDAEIQAVAKAEGLKTSCRASPGYGNWDIGEQASIFRLLPGDKIGVRLSESFMMIPRKSISFAIHIAEKPARMRSENSCRNCDIEDCPYRLLD